MLINFPFQYQVRFTTVSDGNDFAAEHHAYIDWINTTDIPLMNLIALIFSASKISIPLFVSMSASFNSTFSKINQ